MGLLPNNYRRSSSDMKEAVRDPNRPRKPSEQEVAATLMGVEPTCGQCKHYELPEGKRDGAICGTFFEHPGAEAVVYFDSLCCGLFVLQHRDRDSDAWRP